MQILASSQCIVCRLVVRAVHHVLAQVSELAALHELVKRVDVAHVLKETCVVALDIECRQ